MYMFVCSSTHQRINSVGLLQGEDSGGGWRNGGDGGADTKYNTIQYESRIEYKCFTSSPVQSGLYNAP